MFKITRQMHLMGSKYPILTAMLMPCLLILVLLQAWHPGYETNDDFFMNAIVSGFYSGSPDEHLTYSHFLPGLLLKFLFEWHAGVNWYFFYLIFFHWLGWTLIVFSWIRHFKNLYQWVILFTMMVLFETYFYLNLQFTTTASIMACGGISLILSAYLGSRKSLAATIAGAAAIIMASMIRYEPALLAVLLSAPVMLASIPFKKWPGTLLLLLLTSAGIFGSERWNKAYYAGSAEWNTFFTELKTGNKFNDNPAFYETIINERKNLKAINGWSENDLLLFAVFFRNYAPVYNVDAYNRLHQAYSRFRAMPFRDYFYLFRRDFGKLPLIILALLAFLAAGKGLRIGIVLQAGLLAAVSYYIYSDLLMKERVIFGALLCLSISYLFSLSGENNLEIKSGLLRKGGLIFLILASGWMLVSFSGKSISRQKKQRAQLQKDLRLLNDPQSCYIIYGGCIPFEGLPAIENHFHWKKRAFTMLSLSAFHKSPLNQPNLSRFGQTSLEQALGDQRFKVVTFADSAMIPLTPERLERFSRAHLGCSLQKDGDIMVSGSDKRIFWFNGCLPDSLMPIRQNNTLP